MIASAQDQVQFVVDQLDGVRELGSDRYSARCPCHDDQRNSLSIARGDNGKVLLKCHAGCEYSNLAAQLGLSNGASNGDGHQTRQIAATYNYQDENGVLLYQSVRYEPKHFNQRRPHGYSDWIWNMQGVRRVPYRLPDLLNAFEDRQDDWVFIVEGEKDADNLWSAGLIATCNVGGAGKWRDEYSEMLRGKRCCIVADKDKAGREHAQKVAGSLAGKAAEIRIIELPGGAVKDASDFLSAGGSAEIILKSADESAPWTPSSPKEVTNAVGGTPVKTEDFTPVSLGALWQTDPELHEPIIDGMVRRRQVGNVISTSKSYKTYLMLGLAISTVAGRMWLDRFQTTAGRVLIIDLELPKPDLTRRTHDIAQAMHVPLDVVANGIDVISFRGRSGTVDQIEKTLLGMPPRSYSLVIIDPLYKTYPSQFDENSNAQMTALYRRWERMAEHLDCALMIVHHGTKGSQSEKRVVDVGAGASAQSRSADAHITLREHETDDCVVFDARVRSFRPVEPMVLRWQFPKWERDLNLDPTQLRTGRKSRNPDREQPQPAEPGIVWTVDKFVETFVTPDPQDKRLIVSRASVADISGRKAEDFIRLAIADGKAFLWSFPKDKKAYIANRVQGVTHCEVHQ